MKKSVYFLVTMLFITGSYATSDGQTSAFRSRTHSSFSISPTFGYYQYREPSFMKITGPSLWARS